MSKTWPSRSNSPSGRPAWRFLDDGDATTLLSKVSGGGQAAGARADDGAGRVRHGSSVSGLCGQHSEDTAIRKARAASTTAD